MLVEVFSWEYEEAVRLAVESMSHCKYEGFHETQVRIAFVWVLSILVT